MRYVCDICEKHFNTADEARACETAHKKKDAARAEAEQAISDAINAFIAKHRAVPHISLKKDSELVIIDLIYGHLDDLADTMLDIFSEHYKDN